ncbi:MAG: HAMP domain-containing sensor histidine kinase [Breznakibacter sp.]
MSVYDQKRRWKFFLLLGAIFIGSFTLWYTKQLTDELKDGEHKKMELWAEAIRLLSIAEPETETSYMNLINMVISNNTSIPVVLTDSTDVILSYNNIDVPKTNEDGFMRGVLAEMKSEGNVIVIDLGGGDKQFLYFSESILLYKLSWFPIIQLMVVSVFILVAYMAFSGARKAEQDQVWVGMAKETAHQLGTPTSSLLAWIDLLKLKTPDLPMIAEMGKDVGRLKTIADRFSKIGARPDLEPTDLGQLVTNMLGYLKPRSSSQINFSVNNQLPIGCLVRLNPVLFEWVVENLSKNAIDAMEGKGNLTVGLSLNKKYVYMDITDTGKGIPKSMFKTVFEPGFTTKKRGWGLGLTLVKRIVEQYHYGKVFVADSQVGGGTTFRVLLKAKQ